MLPERVVPICEEEIAINVVPSLLQSCLVDHFIAQVFFQQGFQFAFDLTVVIIHGGAKNKVEVLSIVQPMTLATAFAIGFATAIFDRDNTAMKQIPLRIAVGNILNVSISGTSVTEPFIGVS